VTTGGTGGYSHLTPIGVGTGKLFHDHSLSRLDAYKDDGFQSKHSGTFFPQLKYPNPFGEKRK